jgi:hypothetical protein
LWYTALRNGGATANGLSSVEKGVVGRRTRRLFRRGGGLVVDAITLPDTPTLRQVHAPRQPLCNPASAILPYRIIRHGVLVFTNPTTRTARSPFRILGGVSI